MSTAAARLQRVTDRLNPILVKEVRQALRGRYFRILFWLTLFVATLVGLLVVAVQAGDQGDEADIGQPFFLFMFGCMSAAVHVFTPFSAFLATSAEWDENTHDLLVLSNLRPRQIVSGKLLSALIQALLYYSTFGPFLVFAFLLNGVDLLSVGVILLGSFVTCVALSLIGIALASLARVKALRGMLMALFGVGLTLAWGMTMAMAAGIVLQPGELVSKVGQAAVLSYVVCTLVIGGLFGMIATVRFAHEEENRSTGLRVLSSAAVVAAGVWAASMHALTSEPSFANAGEIAAAVLLFLLWLFFLTEREGLGRRASKLVSPRPARALLAAPFLPGGGLAVLLFLSHGAGAVLLTWLAMIVRPSSAHRVLVAMGGVAVFYAYCFVFVALPAGLASSQIKSLRGRALVRAAILVSVPVLVLGPAFLGLLTGNRAWMQMEHPLNPIWLLDELDNTYMSGEAVAALFVLGVVAGLTLLVNLPRVRAGVREVLAASRARRGRAS